MPRWQLISTGFKCLVNYINLQNGTGKITWLYFTFIHVIRFNFSFFLHSYMYFANSIIRNVLEHDMVSKLEFVESVHPQFVDSGATSKVLRPFLPHVD